MLTIEEILDATKSKQGVSSFNELAKKTGISRTSFSNWMHGRNTPDDDTCLLLAQLSGLDAEIVLSSVHALREKNPSVKKVLEKIAGKIKRHAAAWAVVLPAVTL